MIFTIIIITILIIQFVYYMSLLSSSEEPKMEYYRDIPSKENPAIVGMMVKENVDGNDIMATILDLWKKDYIAIENIVVNGKEQCILSETGKDRFLTLKDYENYLLDEIFKDNNKVVFEEFVNSPKFEIIFKNIGNMINKRVDLKSNHKISKVRLFNKINFISHQITIGFILFFPLFNLLFDNYLISFIISYVINIIFSILIKNFIINKNHDVEELIFGYSIIVSLVYTGLLLMSYLLCSYEYEMLNYINLINLGISLFYIIVLLLGKYVKYNKFNFIDIVFLLISIVSSILLNVVGIAICILYFASQIYFKSPSHVYLSTGTEIDKWNALRKFLNDFTIINEREMNEIKVWEDYLIYAIAMGVNKKVISEYLKLTNIKLINSSILEKNYVEKI